MFTGNPGVEDRARCLRAADRAWVTACHFQPGISKWNKVEPTSRWPRSRWTATAGTATGIKLSTNITCGYRRPLTLSTFRSALRVDHQTKTTMFITTTPMDILTRSLSWSPIISTLNSMERPPKTASPLEC